VPGIEPALAHTAVLLGGDELRLFENPDVLSPVTAMMTAKFSETGQEGKVDRASDAIMPDLLYIMYIIGARLAGNADPDQEALSRASHHVV
jgi:hypothetical protein